MKDETSQYVKYRMERAEQALAAAKASMDRCLYNDAVNRIYYACFYAVSALLFSRGLSSRKHSGVRSLFERHFVKDGPLPRAQGRFYHQLYDSRQDGDYADFVEFSRNEVEAWYGQAEEFISEISAQVSTELGVDGET